MGRIKDFFTGDHLIREYRATSTGLQYPSPWLTDALSGSLASAGTRVSVKNALGLTPVFAAVSMVAEQVGQLPLKVYRDVDGQKIEATEHRAWSMLHDKPNLHTPADRFWSTVAAQLLLWGNVFIRKLRGPDSLVDELWLLPPNEVAVNYDAETQTKTFTHYPSVGPARDYTQDGLLHIFGLSTDGIVGQSVIAACKNGLGTAIARDEFEGGFYRRGAVLSGTIEHPNRVGPEGVQNLKTSFMSIYGGHEKAHQVGILEEGATFKPMSHPLQDLQFVEAQQLTRTDIATMFKLPPNYLGGSTGDSLTYATVESNQTHFALHSIAPITTNIAKALSTDPGILPQTRHTAEFVLEAMMRGDANSRADYYVKMVAMGAMSPDEVRNIENLGPRPAGATPPPSQPPQLPAPDGAGTPGTPTLPQGA